MIYRRPVDLCTFSAAILFSLLVVPGARSQSPANSPQPGSNTPQNSPIPGSSPSLPSPAVQPGQPKSTDQKKAAEQLHQQEHQRILGVIPNFNTSYLQDAEALSPKQKFHLVWKSSTDPVIFAVAAIDAGYSQLMNDFPGYHQGMEGYAKRFGASYADTFDGALWGNAILPIMLHQDPRYFRKGSGTIKERLWYAIETTVRCKGDNGKWQPNYSNVLGNVISGGISNLYYPASDRGVGLTFQRAFTVTAEGSLGSIFVEFWPDISRKFSHRKDKELPPPNPPTAERP